MYVCVCSEVTEEQINAAIEAGARSMTDLRDELGVSICCGSCAWYARELLEKAPATHHTMLFKNAAA